MNAGANGQETADTIDSVDIVTSEGRIQTLNRIDLEFGYRKSSFQSMQNLAAIVAVTFRVQASMSAKRRQHEYLERRRISQPLGERTAGSVFQNPSKLGVAAAALIEKAGLKGFKVGGAKVSDIHANFFINLGCSTSCDMLDLVSLVKEKVDEKFGVKLEEEQRDRQPTSESTQMPMSSRWRIFLLYQAAAHSIYRSRINFGSSFENVQKQRAYAPLAASIDLRTLAGLYRESKIGIVDMHKEVRAQHKVYKLGEKSLGSSRSATDDYPKHIFGSLLHSEKMLSTLV